MKGLGQVKLDVVKKFLGLIEQFCSTEADYTGILHPDIEQTEYPNVLTPQVMVSNWDTLFKRMPQGAKLLASQRYDIQKAYELEDTVITEVVWTAEVGADIGAFHRGQKLTAYFCCVFEFKDGLIYRQRNYDCFEKF